MKSKPKLRMLFGLTDHVCMNKLDGIVESARVHGVGHGDNDGDLVPSWTDVIKQSLQSTPHRENGERHKSEPRQSFLIIAGAVLWCLRIVPSQALRMVQNKEG